MDTNEICTYIFFTWYLRLRPITRNILHISTHAYTYIFFSMKISLISYLIFMSQIIYKKECRF